MLGEVQWRNWSTFDELRIRYDNPNQPDTVTEEDWHDTIFAAIGARYQPRRRLELPRRTRLRRVPYPRPDPDNRGNEPTAHGKDPARIARLAGAEEGSRSPL